MAPRCISAFPRASGSPILRNRGTAATAPEPAAIGIADLAKPDYGDAVPVEVDELPVFWACGVTPQAVIAQVRPEFCITHAPGSMLITDLTNSKLASL